MRVIENHWIFKVWFMRNYTGMAVTSNLIICKGEAYEGLIRHEKVHQAQMIRCGGLLFFWLLYLWYYSTGLVKYRNHWKAYRNNPLEVEARNA